MNLLLFTVIDLICGFQIGYMGCKIMQQIKKYKYGKYLQKWKQENIQDEKTKWKRKQIKKSNENKSISFKTDGQRLLKWKNSVIHPYKEDRLAERSSNI